MLRALSSIQVLAISQAAAVSMQVSDGGLGQRIASLSSSQIQSFEKVSVLSMQSAFAFGAANMSNNPPLSCSFFDFYHMEVSNFMVYVRVNTLRTYST